MQVNNKDISFFNIYGSFSDTYSTTEKITKIALPLLTASLFFANSPGYYLLGASFTLLSLSTIIQRAFEQPESAEKVLKVFKTTLVVTGIVIGSLVLGSIPFLIECLMFAIHAKSPEDIAVWFFLLSFTVGNLGDIAYKAFEKASAFSPDQIKNLLQDLKQKKFSHNSFEFYIFLVFKIENSHEVQALSVNFLTPKEIEKLAEKKLAALKRCSSEHEHSDDAVVKNTLIPSLVHKNLLIFSLLLKKLPQEKQDKYFLKILSQLPEIISLNESCKEHVTSFIQTSPLLQKVKNLFQTNLGYLNALNAALDQIEKNPTESIQLFYETRVQIYQLCHDYHLLQKNEIIPLSQEILDISRKLNLIAKKIQPLLEKQKSLEDDVLEDAVWNRLIVDGAAKAQDIVRELQELFGVVNPNEIDEKFKELNLSSVKALLEKQIILEGDLNDKILFKEKVFTHLKSVLKPNQGLGKIPFSLIVHRAGVVASIAIFLFAVPELFIFGCIATKVAQHFHPSFRLRIHERIHEEIDFITPAAFTGPFFKLDAKIKTLFKKVDEGNFFAKMRFFNSYLLPITLQILVINLQTDIPLPDPFLPTVALLQSFSLSSEI